VSRSPLPLRSLLARRKIQITIAAFVCLLLATACAAREGDDIGSPIFNGTTPDGVRIDPPITTLPVPDIEAIRVPHDSFSIQGALDIARPGDLILVDPGVYVEEVIITTPDIVIRGRDRNSVFIDGVHSLGTGLTVRADGVAIENLTVRNYLDDAILVDGTDGPTPLNRFRALHVTTSNTGANGIALRNTTNAQVEQGWLSGHAGAGVLVTECSQCATLITSTLVEFSARGFSVVGAAEGVSIFSSTSRNNRVGIVVEDGPVQPTTGALIAANLVLNNGFTTTPSNDPSIDVSFGAGIHIGGTLNTEIVANRITGNTRTGILLSPNVAGTSDDPIATVAQRNVVEGHLESDIVLALRDGTIDAGLCIVGNGAATRAPEGSASASACGDTNTAPRLFEWTSEHHSTIPYANGPVPPGIDGLLGPDSTPPVPAGPVVRSDPATAVVPTS
jgi:hypothetical protein